MKKSQLINKLSIIYLTIALFLGSAILGISISLKYTIESIINKNNALIPLIALILLIVLSAIINVLKIYIEKRIVFIYENDFKKFLLDHYQKSSYLNFDAKSFEKDFFLKAGDVCRNYLLAKLKIIFYLISSLLILISVAVISPIMLLVIAPFNSLAIYFNISFKEKSKRYDLELSKIKNNYDLSIKDLLSGYKDAFYLGAQNNLLKIYSKNNKSFNSENKIVNSKRKFIDFLKNTFPYIALLNVLIISSLLVYEGFLNPAPFIVLIVLNGSFYFLVNELFLNFFKTKSKKELYLKMIKPIDEEDAQNIINPFPIKTSNLVFKKDNKIFKFKDITINKNDKILIKGSHGFSKSTLIDIISGIVDYNGKVTFNNFVLNSQSIGVFSRVIKSDPLTVDGTVNQNILLDFNGALDIKIVEKYNKLFNEIPSLSHDISSLNLSQKQVVCLLRILIDNPKIILIDNAFSAINKKTIAAIEKMLSKIKCTIIYSTHFKSTEFKPNKIIDLNDYAV